MFRNIPFQSSVKQYLNLIPVLDRHILLVGNVLVLQIVSVVQDRGPISCYGVIVAAKRTEQRRYIDSTMATT